MTEPESRYLSGFNDAIIYVMNLRCPNIDDYAVRDKIVQSLIAEFELQRSAIQPEYMHKAHRPKLNEFC